MTVASGQRLQIIEQVSPGPDIDGQREDLL